jgi:hypothetical protein
VSDIRDESDTEASRRDVSNVLQEHAKGPLAARFAARRLRLRHGRGERWVLFERSLADDERKYYVLNFEPTAGLRHSSGWLAVAGRSNSNTGN